MRWALFAVGVLVLVNPDLAGSWPLAAVAIACFLGAAAIAVVDVTVEEDEPLPRRPRTDGPGTSCEQRIRPVP